MWLSRSGPSSAQPISSPFGPMPQPEAEETNQGLKGEEWGGGTGGMWGAGRDHSCKTLHPGLVALQAGGKSGLPGNSDAPIPQCGSQPPEGSF